MLIDLLSTSNNVSFNIKVAEIVGLHPAIYIAELMNINEKAIRKGKVDGQFFTIDRNYLTKRTTFTKEEQFEIENVLVRVGIMTKSETNDNIVSVNLSALTTLSMSNDETLYTNITKIVEESSKKRKGAKKEAIVDNLKKNILTKNEELKNAYCDWIDAVILKSGYMSSAAVKNGQKLVDEASNHNLDTALRIVGIASTNGWRDMAYAVKAYKERRGK